MESSSAERVRIPRKRGQKRGDRTVRPNSTATASAVLAMSYVATCRLDTPAQAPREPAMGPILATPFPFFKTKLPRGVRWRYPSESPASSLLRSCQQDYEFGDRYEVAETARGGFCQGDSLAGHDDEKTSAHLAGRPTIEDAAATGRLAVRFFPAFRAGRPALKGTVTGFRPPAFPRAFSGARPLPMGAETFQACVCQVGAMDSCLVRAGGPVPVFADWGSAGP